MPLVKEANLIIQELQRPHRLETKMHCELTAEGKSGAVNVAAAVMLNGVRLFEWNPETLENRVFILRELLQRAEEEGLEAVQDLPNEEDPLWDPIEVERLIGVAQVLLEGVLLQVENKDPQQRRPSSGQPDCGNRSCMKFLVRVPQAAGLPEALANDVRVEYSYFIDEKPHKLPTVFGHNCNPEFKYSHTFVQDPVTSRFLEYLQSKLVFRVYGRDAGAAEAAEELARKEKPKEAPVSPAPPVEEPTSTKQEAPAPVSPPNLPGEVSQGGLRAEDAPESPKAPEVVQGKSQASLRLAAEEAVGHAANHPPPPPPPGNILRYPKRESQTDSLSPMTGKTKFCVILSDLREEDMKKLRTAAEMQDGSCGTMAVSKRLMQSWDIAWAVVVWEQCGLHVQTLVTCCIQAQLKKEVEEDPAWVSSLRFRGRAGTAGSSLAFRRTRSSSDVYPTPPGLDGSLGFIWEDKVETKQVVLLIEMELMGSAPDGSISDDRQTLTLRSWLKLESRTLSDAADVFGSLMLSVRHIHRKRIVHSDLKPDNIFCVAERSKVKVVRIGDFGLAGENQLFRQFDQLSSKMLKNKTAMGGTPGYTAPERVSRALGRASNRETYIATFSQTTMDKFNESKIVPGYVAVRLPKTRCLLQEMAESDPAARLSAEEVCKRFEKEVRKELCRSASQLCCDSNPAFEKCSSAAQGGPRRDDTGKRRKGRRRN
eukprot:g11665.t1